MRRAVALVSALLVLPAAAAAEPAGPEAPPRHRPRPLVAGGLTIQVPRVSIGGTGPDWMVVIGGRGYFSFASNRVRVGATGAHGQATVAGNHRTDLAFGGVTLEYVYTPHPRVNLAAGLLVGGGSATLLRRLAAAPAGHPAEAEVTLERSKAFALVDPEVRVEVNAFRWLKLTAGVGYLAAVAKEWGEVGGPSFSFGLLFGSVMEDEARPLTP